MGSIQRLMVNRIIYRCVFLSFIVLAVYGCSYRSGDLRNLMYTDSSFSASSEEYGANQAFIRFAHPDVVLLRPGKKPVRGKQDLVNLFRNLPDTGYVLKWHPAEGIIASSGELGYTWGTYWVLSRPPRRDTFNTGNYVTIWKKTENGSWKFVLDAGNQCLKK